MSIESRVIVKRQPDNQPKATVSDPSCLSHVFPVLLFSNINNNNKRLFSDSSLC